MISMIVAVSTNNGIGRSNDLPWEHIPEDMKWFVSNTKGKPVLMGSKTWDSLPRKPLPNRENIVLTSREFIDGATTLNCRPSEVPNALNSLFGDSEVVVMGGAVVYDSLMPYVSKLYLTRIHQEVEADVFLNIDALMGGNFSLESSIDNEEAGVTFQIWTRNETI